MLENVFQSAGETELLAGATDCSSYCDSLCSFQCYWACIGSAGSDALGAANAEASNAAAPWANG